MIGTARAYLPADVLKVVLPPVPSINALYFTTKFGKRIRTAKAKEWFAAAEEIIAKAMEEQGWKTTESTKVFIDIMTYLPDARKRDVDNQGKAIFDALEHAGVFDNDRWALPRYIDFAIDRQNPRVECVIRLFDEEKDGWIHGI